MREYLIRRQATFTGAQGYRVVDLKLGLPSRRLWATTRSALRWFGRVAAAPARSRGPRRSPL